jgi:hypothetical protein
VAELPSSAAEVSEIVDRASEDTDLLVFVAQPGQPGVLATQPRPPPTTEAGDILRKVQDAASPPAVLVISEQSPTEVGRALPRTVRVVDGDNVIREGSSQGAPGLLRLTIWTLALLAIGALLGRALFPPPQAVVKRIGSGTRTPPPSVGQDSGDVHVSTPHPAGGDLDFSPFQKHSVEVGAWIPQCPFCGAFRPRAERMDTGGSRYRCGQCAEEWQVPAGETWPTVVIRPRHRRAD